MTVFNGAGLQHRCKLGGIDLYYEVSSLFISRIIHAHVLLHVMRKSVTLDLTQLVEAGVTPQYAFEIPFSSDSLHPYFIFAIERPLTRPFVQVTLCFKLQACNTDILQNSENGVGK